MIHVILREVYGDLGGFASLITRTQITDLIAHTDDCDTVSAALNRWQIQLDETKNLWTIRHRSSGYYLSQRRNPSGTWYVIVKSSKSFWKLVSFRVFEFFAAKKVLTEFNFGIETPPAFQDPEKVK